jgi:hypothetical protein
MRIKGSETDKHSDARFPPSEELLENLGRFIDEVANAGVLFATDGLQLSSSKAEANYPIYW